MFKIGFAQFSPIRCDVTANVAAVERLLQGVEADLLVLAHANIPYPTPQHVPARLAGFDRLERLARDDVLTDGERLDRVLDREVLTKLRAVCPQHPHVAGRVAGGDVEAVVDDLEAEAEVEAVGGQGLLETRVGERQDLDGEQRRGERTHAGREREAVRAGKGIDPAGYADQVLRDGAAKVSLAGAGLAG